MNNWDKLDKVREWLQTAGLVAIPFLVAIMGNRVAKSNATRETNAVYVQTAVGILGAPLTNANRSLRPWATQMLVHFSPVPFTDTAEASLARFPLVLAPSLALPVDVSRPAQLLISPKSVTIGPTQAMDFVAFALTAAGDTARVSDLTWTASGGRISDTSTRGGRHYAQFVAPTATGAFVVVAGSASARLADTARVTVQIQAR